MKKSSERIFAVVATLALAFAVSVNVVAQQQDAPKNSGDDKQATGSTSDAWKQALPQSDAMSQTQGVGVGGADGSSEQIEKTLIAQEQKWMKAIKLQDGATLKRLLADDFTLAGSAGDGAPIGRASYLDSVIRDWKLSSYNFDSLSVRLYGETALVTAVYSQQVLISGKDSSGEFLATDLWVKTGRRWRAVARHVSQLPRSVESR